MAELVSLVLGIPGVVDVCIRLTRHILATIDEYQSGLGSMQDALTTLRTHVDAKARALNFVMVHHKLLDESETMGLMTLLQKVQVLLMRADAMIQSFRPTSGPGSRLDRLAFGVYGTGKLKRLLGEMREHEGLIILFMVTILADRGLRQQNPAIPSFPLASEIEVGEHDTSLPEVPRQPGTGTVVDYSSGFLTRSPDSPYTLLEYHPYRGADHERHVVLLGAMLRHADPHAMHILRSTGATMLRLSPDEKGLELCLEVPDGYRGTAQQPRTLRALLVETARSGRGPRHPLEHRLRLIKNVARAIAYLHSAQFVHKNIRPETILVLPPDPDPEHEGSSAVASGFPHALGDAFLVGFETLRGVDFDSSMLGDTDMAASMYRHRSRWGPRPETVFTMLHDVYSLGVIMVEVGCWRSLRVLDTHGQLSLFHPCIAGKEGKLRPQGAAKLHERLLFIAEAELPVFMGSGYAQVAIDCLKCVEEHLGAPERPSGIALSFLSSVIERLEELTFGGSD